MAKRLMAKRLMAKRLMAKRLMAKRLMAKRLMAKRLMAKRLMAKRLGLCLTVAAAGLLLSGCVAPEEPQPARRASTSPATTAAPSVSQGNLEPAPIPNRQMREPNSSVVQFQH